MTSLNLLLWIALGMFSQLAIYLGFTFWRHWQEYWVLRNRAADVTLPLGDDVLETVEGTREAAWSGLRTFRVERKVFENDARSICSFYLRPEDGNVLPPFLPGQYLTFQLDVPMAAGGTEQIVRCYSLSDSPHDDHYRISIKRISSSAGEGGAPGRSSNYFHDHVEVGSSLQVRAPAGHFHIDRSDSPVVLIAGGIGITPMLSMLNRCLAEQPGREVWLFYGVRNSREMVMKSHFESLAATQANFHLRMCFSDPLPEDARVNGTPYPAHVDVRLLRIELPLKPCHFYVCGPSPMMETLVPALEEWGVPESRIHFEAFGPASIRSATATNWPSQGLPSDSDILVTFAQSGKQLAWTQASGTLLELAEANKIAINTGCRVGGCGTCQTTIQAGEVSYRQSPDFDPEPGTCLLCVCMPRTSVTLEA
jgi:ferredoxin-NADP reductase